MPEKDRLNISEKAAQRGEPSYVWRTGQERRLAMIRDFGGESMHGKVLVNGTGVGEYQARLTSEAGLIVGLDIEFPRLIDAKKKNKHLVCAASEHLPFPGGCFDAVLSNEVIEHVEDDRLAVTEIARTLQSGGRLILFCPNRGYPFETHGIYWRGEYHFGNKLFVNYFPRSLRDRLVPHVRIYSRWNLRELIKNLPFVVIHKGTIFGAYDNIIERSPFLGKIVRTVLHFLERTPFKRLGLSHFWVIRKM
jgi:SAM-dependent methyltransferase